jgi:hypothetical protein
MFTSKGLKLTFATILSSMVLMLGLLGTTGVASAHTASAAQSKASTSQSTDQWHRDRNCRVIIIEQVIFVPFQNEWWNPEWDMWGWEQANQNFSWTANNTSGFDTNQWDFNNFNHDDDQFGGFFIIKVTEIIICHGHHHGSHHFEFEER